MVLLARGSGSRRVESRAAMSLDILNFIVTGEKEVDRVQ